MWEHDTPGYMCDIKKAEPYKLPSLNHRQLLGFGIRKYIDFIPRPEREVLVWIYVEGIWEVPSSAARL
jgi:hypothetical protein